MFGYYRITLLVLLSILFCSCSGRVPTLIPTATFDATNPVVDTVSVPTVQQISLSVYHRIGNGGLEQVRWTKDGKKMIVGTTAGVFVYDGNNFSLKNEFEVGRPVYYLAVHPLGNVISVGADKNNYESLTLWDVQTGKSVITLSGDCECVFTNVAFSPNGALFASGNDKGQVWIWEWESGKIIQVLEVDTLSTGSFIRYIEFSPDGLHIAVGSDNQYGVIGLFNVDTGMQILSLDPEIWFLDDFAFSPDGRRLAVVGNIVNTAHPVERYAVKVFDTVTGGFLYSIDLMSKSADFVLYSPDGLSIVTGSCQSFGSHSEVCLKAQIVEWGAEDGKFIRVVSEYASSLVAGDYSPDGQHLSIITWDKIPLLETWDFATGRAIQSVKWFDGPSSPLVFSPDNKTAIWGESNGNIQFLDVDLKTVTSTWHSGEGEVVNLAISDDGLMLATSARYGSIDLWDIQANGVLENIQTRDGFQIYSLEFSSNHRWLAWTEEDLYRMDDSQIQVYDLEQERLKLSITGVSFDIALSPDNSMIAIVDSDNNTIQLFEIETGSLLRTFVAPD